MKDRRDLVSTRTAHLFLQDGGADLDEVLVTARAISDGDEAAWHREWKATAARVHELGSSSLTAGHRLSAREALLRASNYYRTAEFYLRDNPFDDPDAKELSALARDTFATAADLMDTPVEAVAIPYENTTLPGYLWARNRATGRPTLPHQATRRTSSPAWAPSANKSTGRPVAPARWERRLAIVGDVADDLVEQPDRARCRGAGAQDRSGDRTGDRVGENSGCRTEDQG
ncbi:hypothetical protein OHA77_00300 [Streptosporangium sp. NBC_01639]|uniref:hypothetical protein n=1 Tax=Streptosporangium sp. NBC_01639 TaxID=2975948 RepID=UPI00386D3C52|nr:hypothetical protein OHA77_00300 [Streptosporangium sp. NBC_01639]